MTNSIEKVMNFVASGSTISSAILQTYSTSKIRFRLNDKICNMSIVDANLDRKLKNGLLRNRITTYGEFINAISNKQPIRGMGKISLKRIFCQIVNTAWNNMDINERALFLLDVDERNTAKQ